MSKVLSFFPLWLWFLQWVTELQYSVRFTLASLLCCISIFRKVTNTQMFPENTQQWTAQIEFQNLSSYFIILLQYDQWVFSTYVHLYCVCICIWSWASFINTGADPLHKTFVNYCSCKWLDIRWLCNTRLCKLRQSSLPW